MVTIRVPATSANLGPGFDVLGLALPWDNVFRVTPSDTTEIVHHGPYADSITVQGTHMAFAGAQTLALLVGQPLPTWRWDIHVAIPPARGLGSSSSAVVGGMLVANETFGRPLDLDNLLALAIQIEGHPDNAAPALYGGATAAFTDMKDRWCVPLAQQIQASVVVAVPNITQSTAESRRALSPQVSRAAAVFNIAAVSALTHAILTGNQDSWRLGLHDQLHQPARLPRLRGAEQVLRAAQEAGAFGAVLSGSGPTLLAFAPPDRAAAVAEAMKNTWAAHDIQAETRYFDTLAAGAGACDWPAPKGPGG